MGGLERFDGRARHGGDGPRRAGFVRPQRRLAAPYDIVGPFNLDELETLGRIAFGACLVMSRREMAGRSDRAASGGARTATRHAEQFNREFARRFAEPDDASEHRALLELPPEGDLTAAEVNSAFRRLAKTTHPDAGGDHDAYCRLTEARDALLEQASSVN